MKRIFTSRPIFGVILLTLFACLASAARAQTAECPADLVCISREAAVQAVVNADKVKALEADANAKDAAIADLKAALAQMRLEFAARSGENTVLKQQQVADRAVIELLLKYAKPKKFGLINF